MVWPCVEREVNPGKHHLVGKRTRGRSVRQQLDDVKEWTGVNLTEIRRRPDDRVASMEKGCQSCYSQRIE